jgi:RNA polymerase sigma-B factor
MATSTRSSNLAVADVDLPASTEAMLSQLFGLPAGDRRHARLRDRIIEANLPMAYRLARRYTGRGEPIEDLRQVAAMALVKVVDRFDPSRETMFNTFAIPTILGEIKRYFRDNSQMIRISRGHQELSKVVAAATDDLGHQLARTVTPADLATHLRVSAAAVTGAVTAFRTAYPASLDAITPGTTMALNAVVGVVDRRFAEVEDRLLVDRLIAPLGAREKRILNLRFQGGRTQRQISAEVGVSQMHVSRLLDQSLRTMRRAAPALAA